jgi:hypothetical protein
MDEFILQLAIGHPKNYDEECIKRHHTRRVVIYNKGDINDALQHMKENTLKLLNENKFPIRFAKLLKYKIIKLIYNGEIAITSTHNTEYRVIDENKILVMILKLLNVCIGMCEHQIDSAHEELVYRKIKLIIGDPTTGNLRSCSIADFIGYGMYHDSAIYEIQSRR